MLLTSIAGVCLQLGEEKGEEGASSDEERQPRAYIPPRVVAMPYGEGGRRQWIYILYETYCLLAQRRMKVARG